MKKKMNFKAEHDGGKEDFNVVAERQALQAERKKQYDAPVIEYRRRMGNAPELLKQELEHLHAIEPTVTALAHRMLGKYPAPASYETPGVKSAVNKLRDACQGSLNRLSELVPAIGRLLENITVHAAHHTQGYSIDAMVDQDWRLVRGYASGGLNFSDFAEKVAGLENAIKEKVKKAREDQRNGTAAPVDRSAGAPTDEDRARGHGEVITNLQSGD